ncbi:hypothetical protein [Pseudolysinimonas kribbensis]|nr:hypothetical protein [Pseudolysinimonas kribbensis]
MSRSSLDATVDELLPRALEVLQRLVAEPSTVGQEQGAEEVLASELEAIGFAVERLAIPESIGEDPLAGVPSASYAGRYDVIGHRGVGEAAACSSTVTSTWCRRTRAVPGARRRSRPASSMAGFAAGVPPT